MQSKNIFLFTSFIFLVTLICDLFLSKKKISNHFSYSFEKVIVEKYEKTIDKMDWNIFKETYKKLYNREPKKLKFKSFYKKLKKVEKKFNKYRKIGEIICLVFSVILLRNEFQKYSKKKINIIFFYIFNFINILFTSIFSILSFAFIIYCFFIIFTAKTIRKYYSGIPYVDGVYADIFNFDGNNGVEKRAIIHIILDLVVIINFFVVIYCTKNVYYNKRYNNEEEEEKKEEEEENNLFYCDEYQVKKWI